MGITPKFTTNDIQKQFDKVLDQIEKVTINKLSYLGEQCVIHAREMPESVGFTDRTGNLRNSIGYVVFKNGRAVRGGFPENNTVSLDKDEIKLADGIKAGNEVALKVGKELRNGISLVVVAGMNYAVYVESTGRNVLTATETMAKDEMPKILEAIKRQSKGLIDS